MKKLLVSFVALMGMTLVSTTSCLQYDEPGDEFELEQLKLDTAKSNKAKYYMDLYS